MVIVGIDNVIRRPLYESIDHRLSGMGDGIT